MKLFFGIEIQKETKDIPINLDIIHAYLSSPFFESKRAYKSKVEEFAYIDLIDTGYTYLSNLIYHAANT
jgi:hypothetical protein